MKQKRWVREIRQNLPGQPRAVPVIIREQPETGVEPAAQLARFEQRGVKRRHPRSCLPRRLRKSVALTQTFEQQADRLPVRTRWRRSTQLFQRRHYAQAGGRQLPHLIIKLRAP